MALPVFCELNPLMKSNLEIQRINSLTLNIFHILLGRRIAEQEIQVHMLKLLDQYRLSLDSKETLEQDYYMLFRPSKDSKVRFTHR